MKTRQLEPLDLLRRLPNSVFLTSSAIRAGLTRYSLAKLEEKGEIEKLCHGAYRFADADLSEEDTYRAATLRVGEPSAICLLSALAHHNLTDTIPGRTWIMVPVQKRSKLSDLRVVRSRQPKWKIGLLKKDGYSITSIERTIVDCLTLRSKLGSQLGIEALRRTVSRRTTSLGKIVDMAKRLGVLHRIQAYIEALS